MTCKDLFKRLSAFVLVLSICWLSGCGTLFLAKNKDISLNSTPVGATVALDGEVIGVTPMDVTLPTDESHILSFIKDGYQTVLCIVNHQVSWVIVVLDVVLGGLVAIVIDAVTRGWYKLDRDTCSVTLPQR